MYVSGFLSSFLMRSLNDRIGKKWTYFFGCNIGLLAYIWIYFGQGDSFNNVQIYGVCALIGVSSSTMLISSLGMTNDLIGHNTTSGAFVFGAMSFLDKLSNGLAVMAIQTLHDSTGNGNPMFYRNVLTFVCGGATVMALIALLLLSKQSLGARKRRMCQLPIEDDSVQAAGDCVADSKENSSSEAEMESESVRRPLLAANGSEHSVNGPTNRKKHTVQS